MKKAFFLLFFILFLTIFAFQEVNVASASVEKNNNEGTDAFYFIRLNAGEEVSFIYLFPALTKQFQAEEIDALQIEGYKFYLRSYVNILRKKYNEKTAEMQEVDVSDVVFFSDYDAVGFSLNFHSTQALKNFFGEGSVEGKVSGFYVKRITYEIDFPITVEAADMFQNLVGNSVQSWANTFEIEDEKVKKILEAYGDAQYVYEMISTSNQLKSENFYEKNGVYYNVFSKNYAQLSSDSKIYLRSVMPDKKWWYLTLLVAVLIVVVPVEIYLNIRRTKLK